MKGNLQPGKVKKIYRVVTYTITGLLALLIVGLLFCLLVPGYDIYVVKSGSMSPSINVGDIIISGPVSHDLSVGDIVTFKRDQTLVTHRIINIRNGKIQTQGDANEDPDPALTPLDQVQGVYLLDIPYLGYINKFAGTRTGWFLAIIIPTILLVIWIIIEILKETFKPSSSKKMMPAVSNIFRIPASKKAGHPLISFIYEWHQIFRFLFSRTDNHKISLQNNVKLKNTPNPSNSDYSGLPGRETVENVRLQLKENLKRIY